MKVLRNIPEKKQNDYQFIVTFLDIHYKETHLQEVYKAQLQVRRQKNNESLQEYGANIITLLNLTYWIYSEEVKQELAVNNFIEGIRDLEKSQILRMAEIKKISEVFAYDHPFEVVKKKPSVLLLAVIVMVIDFILLI